MPKQYPLHFPVIQFYSHVRVLYPFPWLIPILFLYHFHSEFSGSKMRKLSWININGYSISNSLSWASERTKGPCVLACRTKDVLKGSLRGVASRSRQATIGHRLIIAPRDIFCISSKTTQCINMTNLLQLRRRTKKKTKFKRSHSWSHRLKTAAI